MSVRFIFLRPRDVYDTTAFKGRVLPTGVAGDGPRQSGSLVHHRPMTLYEPFANSIGCCVRILSRLVRVLGTPRLPQSCSGLIMRKVISELDDEHRAVLLEIADFGTAVFSSGLVVAILKSVVDLVV